MRFNPYIPHEQLKSIVSSFVISEQTESSVYQVFPNMAPVFGFQFAGQLSIVDDDTTQTPLSQAGVTGLATRYKVFSNLPATGTVLVYLTELGLSQLTRCPAIHFFNQSIPLDQIFDRNKINAVTERLYTAVTDRERITIVEQFLISELKSASPDTLVAAATRMIRQRQGKLEVNELNKTLYTSASVLERRFKQVIGTTPKKFASLVRLNKVIDELKTDKSLINICYDHDYFDQAHFINDFKRFTGLTPEEFRQRFK
jgi:AraC-like DNA-binding protein